MNVESWVERLRRWAGEKKRGHQLRRQTSGLEFCLADRLAYLNQDHWNAITADRLLFSRAYLETIESFAGPTFVQPRYGLIYHQGSPVAALVFQLLDLKLDEMAKASKKLPAQAREFVSQFRPKILVCGNVLAINESGVCLAPGQPWPVHGLTEVAYRLRRAEKLSGQTDLVVFKDLPHNCPDLEEFRPFGYRGIETEPDMMLEFDSQCHSYSDYLQQLSGKYRKSVKQLKKAVDQSGYQVLLDQPIGAKGPEIHQLYLQVLANADFRPITLPEQFHPTLERNLGENFRCIQIVDSAGTLVGFLSMMRDGQDAIAYYVGFDRQVAQTVPLYLRLLQASVEQTLAWDCRRVTFGRTALEPKARLGAKPILRRSWARYRLPQINWILRGLWSAVPHPTAPQRNPFSSKTEES